MMRDIYPSGFNSFVTPFMLGMIFVLVWCLIGACKVLLELPGQDRKKLFLSFLNPKIMAKILKAKHISYLYTPRTLFKKARELFKKFIHSENLNYEDDLGEIKDVLVNLIFYDKYMSVPLKDEKEKGNNKKNATMNEESMICYLLNKAYLKDIMIKLLNMDVIKKEKEKKKVQKQYNGDN
jgi:hypothetical protein